MGMKRTTAACIAVLMAAWPSIAGARAATPQAARTPSDDVLRTRVQVVLQAASDIGPFNLSVAVSEGVVTLSGRVPAEGLRGASYPIAVLKQNAGAIARTVPGVKNVRFALEIEPPAARGTDRSTGPARGRGRGGPG
jgi:BON domain